MKQLTISKSCKRIEEKSGHPIARATLWKYCDKAKIKAEKPGNEYLIDIRVIDAFAKKWDPEKCKGGRPFGSTKNNRI